jgi:hypothetical protein
METLRPIFGVLALIAFVGLMLWWHFSRSASFLEQWAAKNGYRIVSREHRYLRKGPFFWTFSRGQTVYYVTVEDEQGNQRHGWVRCGNWFFGLLSDNAEVRWED